MTGRRRLLGVIGHASFFGFLWWTLSDGSFYQPWFGVIVVVAATLTSLRNIRHSQGERPPIVLRLRAIAGFVPYFIYQSFKGGLSVARLAFLPQRFVRSHYVEYAVAIPREAALARMCFASCLCIFPGTLSCGIDGDTLTIHVLDVKLLDLEAIRDLERMTAAIFPRA